MKNLPAIFVMSILFLAAALAWSASLVLIPWMALVPFLDQLQPTWVESPVVWLISALVAFIPLLIAMRFAWIGLEGVVERSWEQEWSRWQNWKQQVTGNTK